MIRNAVRFVAAACVILLLLVPTTAFAADVPTWNSNDAYVQDHANLLSNEEKAELNRLGKQLNEGTSAELVVLIVPNIGDASPDEYAVEALRKYKLGKKGKDNGALLLVTTEQYNGSQRWFQLSVGYGLEGALPDGKVGRIIDEVSMPYLKEQQPNAAITEGYKSFYNEIAKEYNWNGEVAQVETVDQSSGDSGFGIPFPIIILIIIIILFNIRGNGGGRGGGPGGRRRRGVPVFFPGSFGGSGGGSGFGGSGGFGGFGGGGGSGGGGGAGRGW